MKVREALGLATSPVTWVPLVRTFLASAVVLGLLMTTAQASPFRAACVKVDISPRESQWMASYGPRRSEGVQDRIFHRILAMDDGETRFVLVSTDVVAVSPAFYTEVAEALQRQTGIGSDHFWWTTTHTHSGPFLGPVGLLEVFRPHWISKLGLNPNPQYSKWAKEQLLEGVERALNQLEPARLGGGTGWSLANINRRPKDVDGKAFFGKNPEGPVDRQIGLIRIERADGSPLALVANYAMHGTVVGRYIHLISGDAPGIVAEYVEQKWGAPVLYVNGAAGNLSPIHEHLDFEGEQQRERNRQALMHFRVLLGDRILKATERIVCTASVKLQATRTVVETPLKQGLTWPESLADYHRVTEFGNSVVRLPMRFLKIGEEVLIWALPVELFAQIALAVRQQSPYPHTFFFGYCNGLWGYLPTAQAFGEGGYEPTISPFTDQVEDDVIKAVIEFFQGGFP